MPSSSFGAAQSPLARIIPRGGAGLRARNLPFVVFLGLIVLTAFLAARLTWQFLAPPDFTAAASGVESAADQGAQGHDRNDRAARIASAHLFGMASAAAAQSAEVNAPKTSLDLTLLGVAAGGDGFPSQAIISNGGNQNQHTYGVGAKLPGGAIIHGIQPDRVVIAHNGRLESLPLPKAGTSILAKQMHFGNGDNQSSVLQTQGGTQRTMNVPPGLRQQLEQHPRRIGDYMRMQPYSAHGKMKGYRVYPGKEPALFQNSGLKPGDVITHVNGVSLTSNAGAMKAMAQLRHAKGTLRLEVLRHGKPVHVTVNLPGG